MKYLPHAAALSLIASQAVAGDLSEPVITEIQDEPQASSSGWIVPLLLLGVGILIATQDDNSTPPPV